ncbi:MAG: hypothetical protein LBP95_11475 [Deltaproteobacteria bacterium]|jgi:hypothetical protein|nr:hypothetical protein [Deltaproteobacteria bacterium]MDR1297265.1 hypothetical protein [Deltaproteobacteria bacterium]
MRAMTHEEMVMVTRRAKWATIITVRPDGVPYAIEGTPFETETEICFMINPNGGTSKNLKGSTHVLLKYTFASDDLEHWMGVSCLGSGRFVRDKKEIVEGWRLLGDVIGVDYSEQGRRFGAAPERSPMMAVKVISRTGRCSSRPGESLPPIYPDANKKSAGTA